MTAKPSRLPLHRIILAEDDDAMRGFLERALEKAGYDVSSFANGADAFERLKEEPFTLLLTDIVMPRMDGIELVTRVRADGELRRLKLVLVSSLNADDDRKRGLTAGADAYIGKNEFRQDVLLQTLERLLG